MHGRLQYHLLQTQMEIQHEKLKEASSTIFNNIGQSLACIRLGLLKAAQQYADTELEQTSRQLADIIKELRLLNTRLDPEEISRKGIVAALDEELQKQTRSTATQCSLQQTGTPVPLSREETFIVFRMLQECMQRTLEYAQPGHMLLSVLYSSHHVIFSLKDNARNFDTNPPLLAAGFLKVLEERARSADAILNVAFTPEYGSHVTIKLSKPQ